MISKYQMLRDDVLLFIRNRINAGIDPVIIAKEILIQKKFPVAKIFNQARAEDIQEMMEWLVNYAYIIHMKEHYRNIDYKKTSKERIDKFYKEKQHGQDSTKNNNCN